MPKLKSFLISPPVAKAMQAADQAAPVRIPVIITPRELAHHQGVALAKEKVKELLTSRGVPFQESDFYVFARLLPEDIRLLCEKKEYIRRIWRDDTCQTHLLSSTTTVKASACWRTFDARGSGVTWAVLDTGIRSDHPHFQQYANIDLDLSRNLSNSPTLEDRNGHGTHVAGIIAGAAKPAEKFPRAATFEEDDDDAVVIDLAGCPSGVAPMAKIVNVKVLDDDGTGAASVAIRGLEYLRKLNQGSQEIKIHGANLSLGYPFDPKWYGCGQSPLCEEVNRTVRSGCVVVISCGNSGYGVTKLNTGEEVPACIGLSITDPANADLAISVGSVHKQAPHVYGISYFSSKGPTGDGRTKPDLVAPGEKVVSCSIQLDKGYEYEERSGTSMAAPHVSGAIAAFLSVHSEFRGNPEKIKEIFLRSAMDLGRAEAFQGAGLVDLMKAMASV